MTQTAPGASKPVSPAPPPPPRRDDGTGLIALDPWLEPYAEHLRNRFQHYLHFRAALDQHGGPSGEMTAGHKFFGLNRGTHEGKAGVWYREWAPGAKHLSLVGDFNGWDRGATPLVRGQWGVWSVFLADEQWSQRLVHESRVKVHVVGADGAGMDRLPAYIRRVVQEMPAGGGHDFVGIYWNPSVAYRFRHAVPERKGGLR